eukprot:5153603-Pyramimonas_sp.AAC.2
MDAAYIDTTVAVHTFCSKGSVRRSVEAGLLGEYWTAQEPSDGFSCTATWLAAAGVASISGCNTATCDSPTLGLASWPLAWSRCTMAVARSRSSSPLPGHSARPKTWWSKRYPIAECARRVWTVTMATAPPRRA